MAMDFAGSPRFGIYLSAGSHGYRECWPLAPPLEDVPIGHKVQAVEALPAVYEPAGQSLHVPAASKAAYLPGTQGVQPLKDKLDMCPARQLSHLDASVPFRTSQNGNCYGEAKAKGIPTRAAPIIQDIRDDAVSKFIKET